MNKKLQGLVLKNSDEIIRLWLRKVDQNHKKKLGQVAEVSDELFEGTNREFANVIFSMVENKGSTEELKTFSETLIQLGWPLSYLTDGMQVFRNVTVDYLLNQTEIVTKEDCIEVLHMVDDWIDPIIHHLVNEYSGNWENIVSLQKVALQELSAPLIPVVQGITIMPLIGTIDTERAKLIMENLLHGVTKHNAEVVLMDITGVPVVDTMVAHHIIQAAEAVRLIGATCILVGIRPEIAQTIVNLGINLERFPTKSSLKKGFEAALELTGRRIIDMDGSGDKIEELLETLSKE